MMNQRYTDEELVVRLWDKEIVKDLMSRRCYYKQSDLHQLELDTLWVQTPEYQQSASLANNLGYFVGMEAIRAYYVDGLQEKRAAQLAVLQQSNPAASLGDGIMNAHTYHTVMVELSGDGRYARYLAYDHGHQTDPQADGTAKGYWTSGHLLADLVKEEGQWRIWHIKGMHDLSIPAAPVPGANAGFGGPPPEEDGQAPQGEPPAQPPAGGPPPMPDLGPDPYEDEYGTPTVPAPYSTKWAWNDLPGQMPNTYEPHETFEPSVSYGPEGHPNPLRSWR